MVLRAMFSQTARMVRNKPTVKPYLAIKRAFNLVGVFTKVVASYYPEEQATLALDNTLRRLNVLLP